MRAGLKRDYVWNTAGTLLQSVTSPALLVIIAHINGNLDVGLFSFAFAVAVALWVVAMWGGRTYQVSDVRDEFGSGDYVRTRILLIAGTFIAALLFCLANQYPLPKSMLIVTLVGFKCVESISDVYYGVLQRNDHLYVSGISLALKAFLGTLSFTFVDMATRSILLSSVALIVANVVLFLSVDLVWVRRLERVPLLLGNTKDWMVSSKKVLVRSGPVFVVSFLVTFTLNIPRYFIDTYHPEENPFFGVIAMPVTLVLLVITFLIQPNIVRLSRLYEANRLSELNTIVKRIGGVVLVVGLIILGGTYAIGVPILNLVFGMDFSPYRIDLSVIVLGAILNAYVSIAINILTVMRHFRALVITLFSSNIALIPLSYLIVPDNGMRGGAILFAVISLVQALVLFRVYLKVAIGSQMPHA